MSFHSTLALRQDDRAGRAGTDSRQSDSIQIPLSADASTLATAYVAEDSEPPPAATQQPKPVTPTVPAANRDVLKLRVLIALEEVNQKLKAYLLKQGQRRRRYPKEVADEYPRGSTPEPIRQKYPDPQDIRVESDTEESFSDEENENEDEVTQDIDASGKADEESAEPGTSSGIADSLEAHPSASFEARKGMCTSDDQEAAPPQTRTEVSEPEQESDSSPWRKPSGKAPA